MGFFKCLTRANSVHDEVLSLYKRGLESAMRSDHDGAMGAYTAAIEMRDAPADLRAMTLYNRALLYGAANQVPKAIQDLNAVLTMTAAPHKVKSAARQKLDRMQRRSMEPSPWRPARSPSRAASRQAVPKSFV
jgi:hypothetical protein